MIGDRLLRVRWVSSSAILRRTGNEDSQWKAVIKYLRLPDRSRDSLAEGRPRSLGFGTAFVRLLDTAPKRQKAKTVKSWPF